LERRGRVLRGGWVGEGKKGDAQYHGRKVRKELRD
jgi:hypothetical protein